MTSEESLALSDKLRAFLHRYIDSIEQVEALVVLRRSGRAWPVRQLAAELSLSEAATQRQTEALAAGGLLDIRLGGEDLVCRYDPVTPELRGGVDLLMDAYATRRGEILRFVLKRSRRPLKDFSDAFKLRGSD